MVGISYFDMFWFLISCFLICMFVRSLLHAYRKFVTKRETAKFANTDLYFMMIGAGFLAIILLWLVERALL